MGLSCSRRLPPGWEKIQANLDEALKSGDPEEVERARRRAEEAGIAVQDYDDVNGYASRLLEVQLKQALRSGDAILIEQACNKAEALGLEKAKLSLARAEAQWLNAQTELNKALESGDSARIQRATRQAEIVGVDTSRVSQRRSIANGKNLSAAECLEFIMSRATMLAAVSVLLYEWSAYNFVFLGRIMPSLGKDLFVAPCMLLFNLAWGLAMWSFLRCHFADPGTVPRRWYEFVRREGDALPVAPARLEWQPGKATLCKRCEVPRPERAHHCHVCGFCVLRMDHHCPWINNCVGFGNHKFFLLLVGYCFFASVVGLATSLPELIRCIAFLAKMQQTGQWQDEDLRLSDVLVFVIFCLLALLFAGLLAPMAATHYELATYNVTTIEGHYEGSNMPNPFDEGTSMANLAQIFGAYGLDWYFPVQPFRPVSDGICFLRDGERGEARDLESEGDVETTEDIWRLRYQVRSARIQHAVELRSESRRPTFSWWWSRPQDSESAKIEAAGEHRWQRSLKTRSQSDGSGRRIVSI